MFKNTYCLSYCYSLVSNEPSQQRFLAPILVEAVRNAADTEMYWHMSGDRKASKVKGFDTFESIRAFVADNYDTHTDTMKRSMVNEHAALKQVLYGIKAEVADVQILKHDYALDKVHFQTYLAIDANILEDTKHLLYVNGDHYSEVDLSSLTESEKKKRIDMAPDVVFTTTGALKALNDKERALIIVNDDIVLKYTVHYQTRSNLTNTMASSHTLFAIKDPKNGGLNAKDYDYVNSLLAK